MSYEAWNGGRLPDGARVVAVAHSKPERRPLGCALAMRVMQSDLYQQLDEAEHADCDELVRQNLEWFKADSAPGVTEALIVQCPGCGEGIAEGMPCRRKRGHVRPPDCCITAELTATRGVTACPPGHCRTPSAPCRGQCIQAVQPRDTKDQPVPCNGAPGVGASCYPTICDQTPMPSPMDYEGEG